MKETTHNKKKLRLPAVREKTTIQMNCGGRKNKGCFITMMPYFKKAA